MKEVRDNRGHFIKGNMPWNKRHRISSTKTEGVSYGLGQG